MTAVRVRLVAWTTVREQLNPRFFYVSGAFALILLAIGSLAGPLSAGETVKIVKDFGLAATELAGVSIAILLGVTMVLGDRDRTILITMLSKPIHRWEWLVGQFLGVAVIVVATVAAFGLALFLVLATLELAGVHQGATGRPIADPLLAIGLVTIAAEATLVAALATFFAAFSSSALVAASFAIGTFIAGQLSGDLRAFGDADRFAPWIEAAVRAVGWSLPAFSVFDLKAEIVHGVPVSLTRVTSVCVYGAVYAAGLLGAAAALFSRREIR